MFLGCFLEEEKKKDRKRSKKKRNLNGDFQGLDTLVSVPGNNQLLLEFVNVLHILLLGKIQHSLRGVFILVL